MASWLVLTLSDVDCHLRTHGNFPDLVPTSACNCKSCFMIEVRSKSYLEYLDITERERNVGMDAYGAVMLRIVYCSTNIPF